VAADPFQNCPGIEGKRTFTWHKRLAKLPKELIFEL
jgi:hypothetical protein